MMPVGNYPYAAGTQPSGAEPMTTMTVQIPERLKHALKQAALDRKTTVKALLIELIEGHLAASKS